MHLLPCCNANHYGYTFKGNKDEDEKTDRTGRTVKRNV